MNEDKDSGAEAETKQEEGRSRNEKKSAAASRARNRTVMLTPEMTGQVRALLQKDGENGSSGDVDGDFVSPLSSAANSQSLLNTAPPVAPSFQKDGDSGVNQRSATVLINRGELREDPGKAPEGEVLAQEPLSEPTKPEESKTFDPMTSVAPSTFERPQQRIGGERQVTEPLVASSRPAPLQPIHVPGRTSPASAPVSETVVVEASHLPRTGATKLVGILVSFDNDDNGEFYEVRAGRWLITSRPTDHGDYLLIDDDTVSALHAFLRGTADGKLQVMDQLSEHGTAVIRKGSDEEIEVVGGLETVNNGDTIRFGERTFLVSLLPVSDS